MALNDGQIFASGISIVMNGPNDPLPVSDGSPVKWIHFEDPDGNTIEPIYDPQGLTSPAGKIAGVKIVVAGAVKVLGLQEQLTSLAERTEALELGTSPFEVAQAGPDPVILDFTENSTIRFTKNVHDTFFDVVPTGVLDGRKYKLIIKTPGGGGGDTLFATSAWVLGPTLTPAGGYYQAGTGASNDIHVCEFIYDAPSSKMWLLGYSRLP